jgi:indole-3-glycerol phosphate synthase
MQEVDVGTIVPSTRDLLQAITTRRRNLALIGLIAADASASEALRLADLNVSAFAAAAPGPLLAQAAGATKTVPSLCLDAAGDRQAVLAARQHGADGVVVDARLPLDEWDRLAKIARSMRMLAVALAVDAASVEAAAKAGARAILLRAGTADAVLELAAKAPRGVTLVGHVETEGPDAADAVRALAGKVDAAVVSPAVHATAGFAELVAEVDP